MIVRAGGLAVGVMVLLWLPGCSSSTSVDPPLGSGNAASLTSVNGVYQGTYSFAGEGTFAVYGAASASGYGYFVDTNGFVYTLPAFSGQATFSGTMTGYAPLGRQFATGNAVEAFQVTGTASGAANSVIAGTFTGAGISGSFTLNLEALPPPDLATMAGNYDGNYIGPGGAAVTGSLTAAGSFSGTDAHGCTLSGTLSAAAGGLYTMTATSSGTDGCAGTINGLAFATTADLSGSFNGAAGNYLYLAGSDTGAALAAELRKD